MGCTTHSNSDDSTSTPGKLNVSASKPLEGGGQKRSLPVLELRAGEQRLRERRPRFALAPGRRHAVLRQLLSVRRQELLRVAEFLLVRRAPIEGQVRGPNA